MKQQTGTTVTTILNLAANQLQIDGRPRKRPGKRRAMREGFAVSLTAAIDNAARIVGASKYQKRLAMTEVYWSIADREWCGLDWFGYDPTTISGLREALDDYDDEQLDTREVIRCVRAAKRCVKGLVAA